MLKYTILIILAIAAIFVTVVLVSNQTAITRAMDSMYLLPRPEKFTELYFENHTQLPNKVSGWNTYKFIFTIHNLEYQQMDYPYEIYIQRGETKTLLVSDSVSLDHDKYISLPQKYSLFKNLRSQIVVELLSNHQKIHFWMDAI